MADPSWKTSSHRRFTLFDAVIMVAATAAGFGLIKATFGTLTPDISRRVTRRQFIMLWILEIIRFCLPCLATFTIAHPILRLRRPRINFRRLMAQPGTVACYAASMVLIIEALGTIAQIGVQPLRVNHRGMVVMLLPQVGFAVLSAWLILASSGRWRPEAGWIDRLGRALGLAWVISLGLNRSLLYFL